LLKVIYVFRIFREASAWAGGSPIRRLSIAVALLDGGRPVGRAVGDFMSFDARCLSPLPSRGGTVLFLC